MKILISLFVVTSLAWGQSTISGTLYADNVSGFTVIGCLLDASTQDCDYDRSPYAEITQGGTSAQYSLENAPAGQYLIIAWKDTNGNGNLDEDADEIGYYVSADGEPALVSPPTSQVDIRVATEQTPANPLTPTRDSSTNPLTPSTNPPATPQGSLIGTWFWGTVSSTSYYNPVTGEWGDASGGGLNYTFNADGTYDGHFLVQNTFYSCTTKIFNYEEGTYTFEDDVLTLIPSVDKTKSEDDCNASSNYEKDIALATKYKFVQFRRDISEFTGEDLGEVFDMTNLIINSAGNLGPDPEDPTPMTFRKETP
jgi:hypothetical protein